VRWLPALAAAVLALSAFNLTFRLGSEGLTEWDPEAMSVQDFLFRSGPGEYFLSSQAIDDPRLLRVAMVGDYSLYQRRDTLPDPN